VENPAFWAENFHTNPLLAFFETMTYKLSTAPAKAYELVCVSD